MPDISLRVKELQSVMFSFINIWYGIRIIRIYSGLLKLNRIMNQGLTQGNDAFQVHFILGVGGYDPAMFRIVLGDFRNFPAPVTVYVSIKRQTGRKQRQKKAANMPPD